MYNFDYYSHEYKTRRILYLDKILLELLTISAHHLLIQYFCFEKAFVKKTQLSLCLAVQREHQNFRKKDSDDAKKPYSGLSILL